MLNKTKKILLTLTLLSTSLFTFTSCGGNKGDDPLTRDQLSSLYKDVAVNTWKSLGINDPVQSKKGLNKKQIANNQTETTDQSNILNIKLNTNSMAGLIYMVGLLYENENFEMVENVAIFDVNINLLGMTIEQNYVLKSYVDLKNNKLSLEGLVSTMGSVQYSNLELNFDFDNNQLLSFRFISHVDIMNQYIDMSFTNDGKYMWYETTNSQDQFAKDVNSAKEELIAKASEISKLSGSFDSAIQSYMDIVNDLSTKLQ